MVQLVRKNNPLNMMKVFFHVVEISFNYQFKYDVSKDNIKGKVMVINTSSGVKIT